LLTLRRTTEEFPGSAIAWLEYGFLLDRLGRELDAIPKYKTAIRLGLPRAQAIEALICLGSSLDTVGRHEAALAQLRRAQKLAPPNDLVANLFLAAALCSVDRPLAAVRLLAAQALSQSQSARVRGYESVIRRKLGIRHSAAAQV